MLIHPTPIQPIHPPEVIYTGLPIRKIHTDKIIQKQINKIMSSKWELKLAYSNCDEPDDGELDEDEIDDELDELNFDDESIDDEDDEEDD